MSDKTFSAQNRRSMPIPPLPSSTTEPAIRAERSTFVAETSVRAGKRPIAVQMEFDRLVALSLLRRYQLH